MRIKLMRVDMNVWKCGQYVVRRRQEDGRNVEYVISGPGVSLRESSAKTLSEVRETLSLMPILL